MTRPRTRNSLFFLLVFILPVFLLIACDDPTCPTCTGGGGQQPETVDLSGKVLDLTTFSPIGGAKVEFADGSGSTTTSEEGCDDDPPAESCGSWTLADVPTPEPNENPRIRITAAGYADSYNNFPFALGIRQYDLMILSSAAFGFLPLAMTGVALPDGGCLVMGVVVRFVGDPTVYPQSVTQLADAAVIVVPDDLTVVYFGPAAPPFGALPDPNLTKTSILGLFGIVVPDATGETGVTSITLSGTDLVGGSFEVSPDSFVRVGLIDVS
jgi:hypothetical protein